MALQIPTKRLVNDGEMEQDSWGQYTAFAGAAYTYSGGLPILTNEICYIKPVATAGDAVALPPAVHGLTIDIYNDGAAELAIFSANQNDTLNDGTAGGYLTCQPNFAYRFACFSDGYWTCENIASGFSGNFQTVSYLDGITAAGTTQGTATPITHVLNRTTNASGANGVLLPAAAAGLQLTVINANTTNALKVYPAGTDKIELAAAGAAYSLAAATSGQAAKVAQFMCVTAGQWHLMLSSN